MFFRLLVQLKLGTNFRNFTRPNNKQIRLVSGKITTKPLEFKKGNLKFIVHTQEMHHAQGCSPLKI